MIRQMPIYEFMEFKNRIEKATGFACFETQPDDQAVFYGTSSKFDDFKTAVGKELSTGSIAFLMDTGKKFMYSILADKWYEI